MSEHSDRYGRIAAGFSARLGACTPDEWGAMSPCENWTARDVVLHSAEVHRNLLKLVLEDASTAPADDPGTTWKEASQAVMDALGDPELCSKVVSSPRGDAPFEQLVGTRLCADTLIHTWDLARAIGADDHLDEEAVSAVYAFMKPNDAMLRVPGGFASKVEPPDDADEQTELICFTGRDPRA